MKRWNGSGEADHRAAAYAVLILILLYVNRMLAAPIIVLAVPFSAIGPCVSLRARLQHEHRCVVGLIALMGVDAETAVFMLLYLIFLTTKPCAKGR